ncbi:hypothetical protein FYJ38_00340 [Clostridium sp. WB02_MRS01]|uniref:hypothetical protein n=1 Tax=Clostridium sp. WB02_MRS01 TaxID=2605777 RepID=UPI0012B338DE|nr:hypothetical protein [Clostridium sp. WB02_MRS01]MSS07087.1 hypothetical protein [Clostridium sp. WB02_MRS01]
MEFIEFKEVLQRHFAEMTKEVTHLFEVEVDKDELWDTYLSSFPAGTNEIYRERTWHDCSCCRQFIKNIGNAVVIKDNLICTIWDLQLNDTTYQPVADALAAFIRSHTVTDIYISKFKSIGTDFNHEQLDNGQVVKWDHFYLNLPDKFVDKSSRSEGDIKGSFRDTRNVFKRSLDEITMDSVDTVLELINSNTLYKGEEWSGVLTEFRRYKKEYDKLTSVKDKDLYAWEQSVKAGGAIGRIRNHSIGTLLINVSEDMDLDLAVKKYEQIVAPSNYKRPKAIFTKKMLEDAKRTITELGYLDSLQRRFANLDDITINNILFSNKDSAKRISGADDIFGDMAKDMAISPKRFSKIEEITAKDFIEKVLPTAKEVETFVENKHDKNFVSMIASINPEAKTMFKWNNGMSWAYTGNITDSDMKQNVKAAGGNVDGVLRFSIQWNEDGKDNCDLDAHCKEPNGDEIYYDNHRKPGISRLGGQLDVDIIDPNGKVAVENITWGDKNRMQPGTYRFFVHQFSGSIRKGFRAEIEFNGEIFTFDYNKSMRSGENVQVAEVVLSSDGEFTIKEKLTGNSTISSREIWGINTNQFVPVSVICYSPNYFDEQDGIGHRHLFFMLKNCKNVEEPNGYYNEFLKNELNEHKRVFEALGAKCHVEDTEDQLSGIGFSMTKRADLVVKVKGATERIMKIKF